jgi:hypothetical protein
MSKEPKPNLPLLRAVLAQIDATPERWDQSMWALRTECGTAFCVAGWAVHISHPDAGLKFDHYGEAFTCTLPGFGDVYILDEARRLLAITGTEANYLFSSFNSRSDVQRHAEAIAARAGESL